MNDVGARGCSSSSASEVQSTLESLVEGDPGVAAVMAFSVQQGRQRRFYQSAFRRLKMTVCFLFFDELTNLFVKIKLASCLRTFRQIS